MFCIIKDDKKYLACNNIKYVVRVPQIVHVKLKAYRNDQSFLQDLPQFILVKGQTFHLTNQNAPSIEGYDFVCCTDNNTIVQDLEEIRVYYIPQNIPDRTKKMWNSSFFQDPSTTGNLFNSDFVNTYSAENCNAMFYGTKITHMPKINMSNVTDITNMFFQCDQLQQLSEQLLDFSKVQNWNAAFYVCNKLKRLDFKLNPNTKVKTFTTVFVNCTNLQYINLTNIDTSQVTSINSLFANCTKLQKVDGKLDLTSCKDVYNAFSNCAVRGLILKNVPRSLDMAASGGIEGQHYVIENYLEE